MTSVIRLLPRKKIERNVVPYPFVLNNVMGKRFSQAFRTNSYLIIAAVLLTLIIARNAISFRRVLNLFIANSIVIFMVKLLFITQDPVYPSLFAEAFGKLISPRLYIALVMYSLSACFYFKGALVPELSFYSIEHAEPIKMPEGIPESLALHRTDRWFILDEKYAYLLTSLLALSLVFTLNLIARNLTVLRLSSEENGLKPLVRIKRRLQLCFKPTLKMFAATFVIFPVAYWIFIRNIIAKVAQIVIRRDWSSAVINLSGFHFKYLFLPIYALPLTFLWSASLEICMAYLSLGPLFRGKPISDTAGADKNGTLVDGLSKKPGTLSSLMAWNELLVIAEHNSSRRKSIYNDVDGERVIWEQIHSEFQKLIEDYLKTFAAKKHEVVKPELKLRDKSETHFLSSNLAATSTADLVQPVGKVSSTYDFVGDPQIKIKPLNPSKLFQPESAFERKLAIYAKSIENRTSTRAERARERIGEIRRRFILQFKKVQEMFFSTWLGFFFRKTLDRNLSMKLTHSQTTAFALRSVARMVTKSIKEDEFGYVQGTIASILDSLDKLAERLENTIANPPTIESSDALVKKDHKSMDVSPAIAMVGQVNGAFAEIVEEFQPYLDNLQVTQSVTSRAKRLSVGSLTVSETAWMS